MLQKICISAFILSLTMVSHGQGKTDTIVTIVDCLKKTSYYEGYTKVTETDYLDCFWESGTDTVITIEDCIKKTVISKKEHKRTITKKLPCYWEGAEVISKGYVIYNPKREKAWYSIQHIYNKDEDQERKSSWGSLGGYYCRKLGLDKHGTDTIWLDVNMMEEVLLALKQSKHQHTEADTTINSANVLLVVNELRAGGCRCGNNDMQPTLPLKWSKDLEIIAFNHAKDMYQRKYFSHNSPEGKTPFDRIDEYGIRYGIAGENIHRGGYDGVAAVYGWEKSPGHCANMMNKGYRYVGVARYGNKYCMLLSN